MNFSFSPIFNPAIVISATCTLMIYYNTVTHALWPSLLRAPRVVTKFIDFNPFSRAHRLELKYNVRVIKARILHHNYNTYTTGVRHCTLHFLFFDLAGHHEDLSSPPSIVLVITRKYTEYNNNNTWAIVHIIAYILALYSYINGMGKTCRWSNKQSFPRDAYHGGGKKKNEPIVNAVRHFLYNWLSKTFFPDTTRHLSIIRTSAGDSVHCCLPGSN